jgi:non-ribosomal peptide synthetase component F
MNPTLRNDTADLPLPPLCVHELFEQQAQRTPDAIAVVCQDQQLSYRELNLRADRLAAGLSALGAGPETRVGLCLERSLEMLTATLAVLKAGAAYVPLDPAYPPERLRFLIADAGIAIVLSLQCWREQLPLPPRRNQRPGAAPAPTIWPT